MRADGLGRLAGTFSKAGAALREDIDHPYTHDLQELGRNSKGRW